MGLSPFPLCEQLHGGGCSNEGLGPDKFFRFMGVIFGLIRNDDLSAVQVTGVS